MNGGGDIYSLMASFINKFVVGGYNHVNLGISLVDNFLWIDLNGPEALSPSEASLAAEPK
jgi:hypothetical protein